MIKLLGRQTSGNVQKVIFMLEEASIPYTREDYGRQFGNTQTPEYLALNPNAKVPTLIDGDVVIWESHTILRYLATTHAPGLTGATAAERSAVERWMFKEAKKPAAERVSDFDAQAKDLVAMLAIANAHLAGREFFALDKLTIADMALGAILKRCVAFPIDIPSYSNLGRWLTHLDSRPAFQLATGAKPTVSSAA
jgi:glutathione S-transferase